MKDGQSMMETLEELFGDEPFGPVEEELFKWFVFVYNGRGNDIKNLDSLDFEAFKNHLTVLIDSIYHWHQEVKNQ